MKCVLLLIFKGFILFHWYGVCLSLDTKHNLRNILTPEEWHYFVGSASEEDVSLIETPHRHRRSKRSTSVTLDSLNITMNLKPVNDFLNIPVIRRLTENSTQFVDYDPNCYFKSDWPYRAALRICDGLSGIIMDVNNNNSILTINPLPKRIQLKSSPQHHIIVKRSLQDIQQNLDTMFNLQNFKFRRKSSMDHDVNFITDSSKSATTTTNHFDSISSDSSFDVERFKRSPSPSYDWRTNENRGDKYKRSAPPLGSIINVETAVFVDKDLYKYMTTIFAESTEKELVKFVLTMVNAVQLLYHDPSLGWKVNFIMKRLEILHSDPTGLTRTQNIDQFLNNFCTWQRTQNPDGDNDPLHWDHALILTGLDLYVLSKNGKLSNQVVGLAPVAGMCTVTSSCTVNEGRHFESVYVVAHEIGHNLGMRHDGTQAGNNCDPGSYLMSPTLGSGKITWSTCSRQYLHKFLESSQSECLMDIGNQGDVLDHSSNGLFPGERFDANQQCMFRYGKGARHSPSQPLDEICQDLHCHRDKYTWTSHPALEGSICSSNKWCRSGRCILKGLSAIQAGYIPNQVIHGSWSEWSPWSECASACLTNDVDENDIPSAGVMISGRRCNNPRPENGGNLCDGNDKKYQTCIPDQCGNVKKTTVKNFADEVCSRAKAVDSELLGQGLQRTSSDAEEACTVWCFKKQGGYKSRGWSFPDGTACRMRNKRKSSYCINGLCQEFVCSRYAHEGSLYLHSPEMCLQLESNQQVLFSRDKRRPLSLLYQWTFASACHSNCMVPGTGLRLVDRKVCPQCNLTSSIQLCQIQSESCSRSISAVEYATKLCSKYSERVRRLSGLGVQLSPVGDDKDRPCRVACQDESVLHRFYLVNGEEGWFPFGTDCSRGDDSKKAFCVTGKCLEFGSDDTPLHDTQFTLPSLPRT